MKGNSYVCVGNFRIKARKLLTDKAINVCTFSRYVILGELLVVDVRVNPTLSLFTDFENFKTFKPADLHLGNVHAMLDQTIAWSGALKNLR